MEMVDRLQKAKDQRTVEEKGRKVVSVCGRCRQSVAKQNYKSGAIFDWTLFECSLCKQDTRYIHSTTMVEETTGHHWNTGTQRARMLTDPEFSSFSVPEQKHLFLWFAKEDLLKSLAENNRSRELLLLGKATSEQIYADQDHSQESFEKMNDFFIRLFSDPPPSYATADVNNKKDKTCLQAQPKTAIQQDTLVKKDPVPVVTVTSAELSQAKALGHSEFDVYYDFYGAARKRYAALLANPSSKASFHFGYETLRTNDKDVVRSLFCSTEGTLRKLWKGKHIKDLEAILAWEKKRFDQLDNRPQRTSLM